IGRGGDGVGTILMAVARRQKSCYHGARLPARCKMRLGAAPAHNSRRSAILPSWLGAADAFPTAEETRVHHVGRLGGCRVAARDARAAARADIPGRWHLRGHTMITKFDSSYYGTVDMENLGYVGTPINERRYSQAELGGALHKVVEYAKCMDERGYNTFWMAEHHFQPEGTELIPNLLMMAMHLCGVTKNLRIGCGFNVVPMWHPLRLAEDYAMADILTGGRVIFGVARGYHTREVETFGAPLRDQKANRELFEEGVDILFKAFEGKPFSHKGKYYT